MLKIKHSMNVAFGVYSLNLAVIKKPV